MDCRTTSTTDRRRSGALAGFTLVEMLVSVALGALVVGAVTGISIYSARSFAGLANYTEMEAASMNALDQITRDVRQTTGLTSCSSNQLTFSAGTNAPLVFSYSPTSRTLTRRQGASLAVLLTECDSLQFSLYQRTPIAGTFDMNPIGTATNETKVVLASWVCSRKILGFKANTENAQSARIVIRAF